MKPALGISRIDISKEALSTGMAAERKLIDKRPQPINDAPSVGAEKPRFAASRTVHSNRFGFPAMRLRNRSLWRVLMLHSPG
jgi:hypothetical protein